MGVCNSVDTTPVGDGDQERSAGVTASRSAFAERTLCTTLSSVLPSR